MHLSKGTLLRYIRDDIEHGRLEDPQEARVVDPRITYADMRIMAEKSKVKLSPRVERLNHVMSCWDRF